jgi:hypothetical protein
MKRQGGMEVPNEERIVRAKAVFAAAPETMPYV